MQLVIRKACIFHFFSGSLSSKQLFCLPHNYISIAVSAMPASESLGWMMITFIGVRLGLINILMVWSNDLLIGFRHCEYNAAKR